MTRPLCFLLLLCALGCGPRTPPADTAAVATLDDATRAEADRLAAQLLDTTRAQEERVALVDAHPDKGLALLDALVRELAPGTEEEYRRIPWIWRVTLAAGRRNDAGELRRLLGRTLPAPGEPLRDWQAVVVGGGLINGISREGGWPAARFEEILAEDAALRARWQHTLERAAAVADDPDVPAPTRYDALRMIALEPWARSGARLVGYLDAAAPWQLQMGAVHGLSDMPVPQVAPALLDGLDELDARNRPRVYDALLRTTPRTAALLDAVAAGTVTAADLGAERVDRLRNHPDTTLRRQARRLLPE